MYKRQAYDMLTWLGNSYWNNNMVSTHDPKKTFNLDICGGYPSLVMKMLVYSEPGLISLLPCKPQQWRSGHINGVASVSYTHLVHLVGYMEWTGKV